MFRCDGERLVEVAETFQETLYESWFATLGTGTDVRVRLASDAHPNAARYVFEQWRGTFEGEPALERVVAIPTSFGYPTPHCAARDNVLFVGGSLGAGRLVSLDLEDPSTTWRCLLPTPDPDEMGAHNTVRAVRVDGDRLLCVDTSFGATDPRWCVFDVTNPREVVPDKSIVFASTNVNTRGREYVEQVIACGRFVIARTRARFSEGWLHDLHFFERGSLRAVGTSSQWYEASWGAVHVDTIAGCDELLAQCERGGVRITDLRAIDFAAAPGGRAASTTPVHRIERANREPARVYFVDPSRLIVVWRAPDESHEVTLEAL